MSKEILIQNIKGIVKAYKERKLGDTTMPEDTHPLLSTQEEKLLYYTLPMALNYQRNSYKLWESAKATWEDEETKVVFDLPYINNTQESEIRLLLLKHKLGLQPNKHTDTWIRISKTIDSNWGSISELIKSTNSDFLQLKQVIQIDYKKSFPYLSGPKIFNYWSYIIQEYCGCKLTNRDMIEIAPDTHVIQASVKLGVISNLEAKKMTRDQISSKWREVLKGTGIDPIDVHSPLWFWSRGGFR